MKYHLAIFTTGWINLILDGSKTIESRFSKVRCAPFGKVHAGDIVYMKESGGLVKGMFSVLRVETFCNLTEARVCSLYRQYRERIFAQTYPSTAGGLPVTYDPPDKWLASKYATLIHVRNVTAFAQPFPYHKRDRRA